MKKLLSLLLILALLCAVPACAASIDISALSDDELTALQDEIKHELQRRQNEADRAAEVPEGEIRYENDGMGRPKICFASEEQLRSCLSRVDLTPENWREYLGDNLYPWQYTSTNNFGEITRSEDARLVGFGFREGYVGCYRDVGMKFTGKSEFSAKGEWNEVHDTYTITEESWKESAEPFSFDMYSTSPLKNIHLESYECTAAVGALYVLKVDPEITRWLSAPDVSFIEIYVGDAWRGEVGYLDVLYDSLYPQ